MAFTDRGIIAMDVSLNGESIFGQLRKEWGWLLAEGALLVVLGLIAIAVSGLTTLATVAFLGWLLIIGGVVQVARSFTAGKWGSFFLELFTGICYMVAGVLTVSSPGLTAMTLTFLLAPVFIVSGIFRASVAIASRHPQWGWSVASGVVSVVLGAMIWNQWPASSLWLIGTFVGAELLFSGMAISSFALSLRRYLPQNGFRVAA